MYTAIYLVAILAAFYFMLIRPQKKKSKELKNLRDNLKIGDEVITIGGICGKIKKVSEDTVILKTQDVTLKVTKWAIGSVESSNGQNNHKEDAKPEVKEIESDENKLEENI